MTGFEPATTRPPAVYANRTAPHPEFIKIILGLRKLKTALFQNLPKENTF